MEDKIFDVTSITMLVLGIALAGNPSGCGKIDLRCAVQAGGLVSRSTSLAKAA